MLKGSKRYTVAILTRAITRKGVSSSSIAYRKSFYAKSRVDALRKALPFIIKYVLPKADGDIKYVSVNVGLKGNVTASAFRLTPIRILRKNGSIVGKY